MSDRPCRLPEYCPRVLAVCGSDGRKEKIQRSSSAVPQAKDEEGFALKEIQSITDLNT